ncbi:MAG: DUF4271 domain-containing protein [Bacteroidota bacterium]
MKKAFIGFLILQALGCVQVQGQEDFYGLSNLEDLTLALIHTNDQGVSMPVTDLSQHKWAGFFLQAQSTMDLVICHKEPWSVWIDGRRFRGSEDKCDTLYWKDLSSLLIKDQTFLSLYSEGGLQGLSIRSATKKKQEKLAVLPKPRVEDHLQDFVIVGGLLLMLLFGVVIYGHPNRMNYLKNYAFSLKANTYEVADFRLFSTVGLDYSFVICTLVSFLWIYLKYSFFSSGTDSGLFSVVVQWLFVLAVCFLFLLSKWLLSWAISRMYAWKRVFEYQVFDFINFIFLLGGATSVLLFLDYLMNLGFRNWAMNNSMLLVLSVLGGSSLFVSIKFLRNSTRNKLLIISYLCATEILPTIVAVGWFFK